MDQDNHLNYDDSKSQSYELEIKNEPSINKKELPNKAQTVRVNGQEKCFVVYKVDDVPPWYLCIFLGFQHYLTMFGSMMAVPYLIAPKLCMGEDNPAQAYLCATTMFASGLVTMIQSTFGVRLPIIQGSTFSYLIPTFTLLSLPQWKCPIPPNGTVLNENETELYYGEAVWQPRIREVQGAIAIAALLQVILGVTGIVGFLLKYISPLTVTATITLIGLSLMDNAVEMASLNWPVSASTMILLILFSQYIREIEFPCLGYEKGKGFSKKNFPLFKLFPVILAIIIMWIVCLILTETNYFDSSDPARTDLKVKMIEKAPWFRVPYPGQWGTPTVSVAGVVSMLSAAIATMFESIGNYYACARLTGAAVPPAHAMNRGIVIEGLGSVLTAMWGTGNGTTSYAENIGAIGVTKVGSRRTVQMAAVVLIVLGVITKFGAVFVSMPDPIVGGVFCIMFSILTAVGLSNVQFVDLNSARNLFILGFSLFFGKGFPNWVSRQEGVIKTGSTTADQTLDVILTSSMLIGGLLAFVLDNTIPGTDEERGILKWLDETQGSGSDEDEGCETYNLPFIMPIIRKLKFLRYLPISPTYKKPKFPTIDCRRCKKKE